MFFDREDLNSYNGFIYKVRNAYDIASGLIKVNQNKFKFSYEGKTKQKVLDNNFSDFKTNIYSLFEISSNDLIIFHIPKELNIKINEFFDENTFNLFYQEIININKDLLKKSKIILEKTDKLPTPIKEDDSMRHFEEFDIDVKYTQLPLDALK